MLLERALPESGSEYIHPITERLARLEYTNPFFKDYVATALLHIETQDYYPRLAEDLEKTVELIESKDISNEEKQDIERSVALCVALHQTNVNNPQKKNFRKTEIDEITQRPLAYAHHPLRAMREFLEESDRASVAIAINLHDTIEDVEIENNGQRIKGADLATLIAEEFNTYPTVPILIEAVTAPDVEKMPPEHIQEMLSSGLAKSTLEIYLGDKNDIDIEKTNQFSIEKLEERIIKANAALAHIFLVCRNSTNDDSEYYHLLRDAFTVKIEDAYDNMGSGAISEAAYIRNRFLTLMARLYGWEMDTKLLSRLVNLYDQDPFNLHSKLEDVNKQLESPDIKRIEELLVSLLANNRITDATVKARPQIVQKGETATRPGVQFYIQVPPEDYDITIKTVEEQIAQGDYLGICQGDSTTVAVKPEYGTLHKIIRWLKQGKSSMYSIKEQMEKKWKNGIETYSKTRAYLRIDAKGESPSQSIRFKEHEGKVYLEDQLFRLPPGASFEDALTLVDKLFVATDADWPEIFGDEV